MDKKRKNWQKKSINKIFVDIYNLISSFNEKNKKN